MCYTDGMVMSQESITILGVGVALAGLILVQGNNVNQRIDHLVAELADVRERLARVETRLAIPSGADTALAASLTTDAPDG